MTELENIQNELTTLLDKARDVSTFDISQDDKDNLVNGLDDTLSDLTAVIETKKEDLALEYPVPADWEQHRSAYYANIL